MKTVRSDSWIYKLYEAQVSRTTGYWAEDIPDRPTNVCDMGKRAFFEAFRHFMEFVLIVTIGVTVGWLVLVPLLSIGFYVFTDNPFIIWFGPAGEAVFVVEFLVAIAAAFMGAVVGIFKLLKISFRYMSFPEFTYTFASNKLEGICTPLEIEVIRGKDDNS